MMKEYIITDERLFPHFKEYIETLAAQKIAEERK